MSNAITKKARAGSIIQVTRMDGKLIFDVKGAGNLTLDPDKVSAENRSRAMYHGFEQRVRDAGALLRDTDNGKSATPADKLAAMARIVEHLMSGATEWAIKAAAGGGTDHGLTILALMRVKAWDIDQASAQIEKIALAKGLERKDVLANLAKNPEIIRAVGDIKAERAAKSAVDASDLLDEMGDDAEDDEEDAE
jgi:hypothetical protein